MPTEVTDGLHDRAIVWLRSQLRFERHHAAPGQVDDAVVEAGHVGMLLAMEQVGAITPEEVAAWRRMLRDPVARREPSCEPLPQAAKERATGHLEALAAGVSPSALEAGTACFSAVAAYAATGILSGDEALAWRERLRAQMGLEPERPPHCSRRDLLRVVPGPAERVHGLRITSVELYADGAVLQWHSASRWPDGPATPRVWNDLDIETAPEDDCCAHTLSDDSGTCYRGGGGPDFGINGAGWVVRFGTSVFTPAVPTGARRLHVPLYDGVIEIDL